MSQTMVEVTRGPLVESIHRGDIAVVSPSGELLYHLGDPDKVTYMRSSAKPIQALAVVESGAADHFGFTERELAVTCASHVAEPFHVEAVLSILSKLGLDESALKCGSEPPGDVPSWVNLIKAGKEPGAVHNNCSGKHAGMLAVCVEKGWPIDDYYRPDHPLQQLLLHNMAEVSGFPADDIAVGVDGCGVVVWGVPIRTMALAFARLADPSGLPPERQEAVRRIVAAVQKYPEMTSGTGRFNSVLIDVARPQVIAKGGAQGVYCVGHLTSRTGIALKVEDGNGRATPPATVAVLDQLGLLSSEQADALGEFYHPKNTNVRGEVVGELRPVFELERG